LQRNDHGTGQGLRLRDFEVAGTVFASLLGLLLLLTFQLRSDAHGRAIRLAIDDARLISSVIVEPHEGEILVGAPLSSESSATLDEAFASVVADGRISGAQILDLHSLVLWSSTRVGVGTNLHPGENFADALRGHVVSQGKDEEDAHFGNVVEVLVPEPGTAQPRWVVEAFVPLAPIEAGATRNALVVFGIGFAIIGALTFGILRLRRRAGERELQALLDARTGLPNGRALAERMGRDCARSENARLALAVVSVDGLRRTDNVLGVEVGDAAFREIGDRLVRSVGKEEVVARIGNNAFALLLDPQADRETTTLRVEGIVNELTGRVRVGTRDLEANAHAGIVFAQGVADPFALLREAGIAFEVAKARFARVAVFEDSMETELGDRLALEAELHQAVDLGQMRVHFQPTFRLTDGCATGMEALLRWQHPIEGAIPPDRFIPLAEADGFIVALGDFVLETACAQLKEWHDSDPELAGLSVAVNVSSRQLREHDFVGRVRSLLERTQLDPQRLTIEVTESIFVEEAVVNRLHELRGMGVRIALDDFGTGYSALSYLDRLPLDILKIDQSFVGELDQRPDRAATTALIVRLARLFGLETIAEGVERPQELAVLRTLDCDIAQGFLLARPCAAPEALELIRASGAVPRDTDNGRLRVRPGLGHSTVNITLGPIASDKVLAWADYTTASIELAACGKLGVDVPVGVLGAVERYVRVWRAAAGSRATFVWSGDEDVELLWSVIHYWRMISTALVERPQTDERFMPVPALQFHETLLGSFLSALATDDRTPHHAVTIQRQWPTPTGA
jgi:diguanylate cyclase (GGDEF)-like protein